MIFRRSIVQYFQMPPAVDEIEQLDSCKLLGIMSETKSNLKMDSYVLFALSQCALCICI